MNSALCVACEGSLQNLHKMLPPRIPPPKCKVGGSIYESIYEFASWTIPRATCIRCRFKWATSHGGRPHHHVAKCHDENANSNVAILHHTMAATQSPSQASENQDTIALDRKVYLMGYALCRRPPIIAHCFRIADSLWRLGGPWAHFGTTVRGNAAVVTAR